MFRVSDDEATITVLEGVVLASNNQGELRITPGESAQASKGQAPQKRLIVKPRDLVQWGLYYPPVLSTAAVAAASPAMSEAANCAANGNNACAFAALDKVPQAQRDAQYLLLRSTVLLSAGRVDEARTEIDAALQKDPNSGAAYALRSVIAVALNENETALADARRAVELSPQSAAATIALSYALQANLQLEPARTALLALVEQQPDDALAWVTPGGTSPDARRPQRGYRRSRTCGGAAAGIGPDPERARVHGTRSKSIPHGRRPPSNRR